MQTNIISIFLPLETINFTEISLLRREREGKEGEFEGALEEYKRLKKK